MYFDQDEAEDLLLLLADMRSAKTSVIPSANATTKSEPIWGPDGSEVTDLDALAAVLSTTKDMAAITAVKELAGPVYDTAHLHLLVNKRNRRGLREDKWERMLKRANLLAISRIQGKSLDVKKMRYVRTPEGAEHFGQPIGSPIKPDLNVGNVVAETWDDLTADDIDELNSYAVQAMNEEWEVRKAAPIGSKKRYDTNQKAAIQGYRGWSWDMNKVLRTPKNKHDSLSLRGAPPGNNWRAIDREISQSKMLMTATMRTKHPMVVRRIIPAMALPDGDPEGRVITDRGWQSSAVFPEDSPFYKGDSWVKWLKHHSDEYARKNPKAPRDPLWPEDSDGNPLPQVAMTIRVPPGAKVLWMPDQKEHHELVLTPKTKLRVVSTEKEDGRIVSMVVEVVV